MTKPTIEEWVKSVRAENQWDDDANTIEEELLKALRIIKHLMKAMGVGMKFFSKQTCEKLEKLGCLSDPSITYYWTWKHWKENPDDSLTLDPCSSNGAYSEIKAFSIYDFLSDEPYALENCKKVFGDKEPEVTKDAMGGTTISFFNNYEMARMSLVNVPDQEAFILNALEGNK